MAENARCSADCRKVNVVLCAVFRAGCDDRRFFEIQCAGHAAGQDHQLHIVRCNVFFFDVSCYGDTVGAGDCFAADADGLYFKLCAAQNIHGRERFDLFKSVCKKYIDHNKSSSFSLIS